MDNKFFVSYSYSQDLNNYVRQLRNKFKFQFGMDVFEMSKKYFPEDFLSKVIDAPSDTHAESIVLDYWKQTRNDKFNDNIVKQANEYNLYLYENQSKIIEKLEDLYKNKYPFEKVNIFLTTFYRCPYNYPYWFMSYSDCSNEKLIEVCIHELNHFMFYYYWKNKFQKKGISERQFENLKESLAVLTSSDPLNENKYKTDILPLQKFVFENSKKPLKKIIDLVLENKILDYPNNK